MLMLYYDACVVRNLSFQIFYYTSWQQKLFCHYEYKNKSLRPTPRPNKTYTEKFITISWAVLEEFGNKNILILEI